MDHLTQNINEKATRMDTYLICKVMRKGQRAMRQCLAAFQEDDPNFQLVRFHRQQAVKYASRADDYFEAISNDRKKAVEEMAKIINRFGTNSVSKMLIRQFENCLNNCKRAKSFVKKAKSYAKEAVRIEQCLMRLNR